MVRIIFSNADHYFFSFPLLGPRKLIKSVAGKPTFEKVG